MQDIRQKFSIIKQKVENNVFDPYLLNYIEMPVIDEDKLLILISILEQLDLPLEQMETYCISTMLVQIALDTHEHISSIRDEKSRQLTVLAGDYYSGLYYKRLAQSGDILIIKALSEGIKAVNEQKVAVYYKESKEINKLMKSMMLIESSLLIKLSEYFNADLWNEVFGNLLFFKRLLHEKSQFIQTGRSFLFDAMEYILFPAFESTYMDLSSDQKNKLLTVCDDQLERSKRVIETGVAKLPFLNQYLESKIKSLLNQFQPCAKSFVEEG